MTIRVVTEDGQNRLLTCNSYEFEANKVCNWITLNDNGNISIIEDITDIQLVSIK